MFECLVGYPPFCSETTHETYQKIINWQRYLVIPDDVHLSREAEDMVKRSVFPPVSPPSHSHTIHKLKQRCRLITSPDRRLNVEQIKQHPFFYGVDWASIRHIDAPFVPRLRSITDTSYFPTDELDQAPEEPVAADAGGANKDLAFLGYTFKRFQISERSI